jgi:L-glyceraldehyde reductase
LDLATIYQNQREVAEGIKRAYKDIPGLKREDLFIVRLQRSLAYSDAN